MKHIVLVANTSWSMYNFRIGLILDLLKKYKVTIIAPVDHTSEKLRMVGCDFINISLCNKGANPFSDFMFFFRLYMFYKSSRPDFIIHYTVKPNIYGSLAAALGRIPSIAITTGLGYAFSNDNLVAKISRALYKLACKYPKQIWFLNEEDLNTFVNNKIVNRGRTFLLHGEGIDIKHFSPRDKKNSDNCIRFLLIARMLWDKGIAEFVEAAQIVRCKYPNAIFQLLGDSDSINPNAIGFSIINSWEQQGIIHYLGMTEDVRDVIAQADCVVLPSFYREGVPRVLMEAASMGKPIITTDNVGCRDVVINGKTGFICPIKNAQALADNCHKILTMSNDERMKMGAMGRIYIIDKFDENKTLMHYHMALSKFC